MLLLTWRKPFSADDAVAVRLRIEHECAELQADEWIACGAIYEWQWRKVTPLSAMRVDGLDEFLDVAAWCIARLADPSTARNEPGLLRHAIANACARNRRWVRMQCCAHGIRDGAMSLCRWSASGTQWNTATRRLSTREWLLAPEPVQDDIGNHKRHSHPRPCDPDPSPAPLPGHFPDRIQGDVGDQRFTHRARNGGGS